MAVMHALAATQIPKPSDEQAFERASLRLWRGLLADPAVQLNARRGQGQDGVDLYGMRDRNPDQYVGIQCKLKGDGKQLTEREVREEVQKALTFEPSLREYFVVTTAPDDGKLHELARTITRELHAAGRDMLIYIWGWGNLEERICQDDEARRAFDPGYAPFTARIFEQNLEIGRAQSEFRSEMGAGFLAISSQIAEIRSDIQTPPGDSTTAHSVLEAHLDAEIDTYREIANEGKPRAALMLFQRLLSRVGGTASGRLLFRIKANIGSCLLGLGDDRAAASLLAEAYQHAPDEPKAIANKAFSLLVGGQWKELLTFGPNALERDPSNEALAGYLVQAARFDPSIEEALDLVPDGLRQSGPVAIARVDFMRFRRTPAEWWAAARDALAAFPNDPQAVQFAAEADIDEILTNVSFQRTRLLNLAQRTRLEAAVAALVPLWDKARGTDGVLHTADVALCNNIIVALHALDDLPGALAVARQGLALAPDDVDLLSRAVPLALDSHDDDLAEELLAKLPAGPDATVLWFRFYSSRSNWIELVRLHEIMAEHIPVVERTVIETAAKLAAIKIGDSANREEQIERIVREVEGDARASIVVADFAAMDQLDTIADTAFLNALKLISEESHIAGRAMVARYAARRGNWSVVADLLDGHVAEDHDSEELRALASAFVNDVPIRQRALRFFARLPQHIRELPLFLHAEGVLHANRGDLPEAESALRRAIEAKPDIDSYLALFSVLRRSERAREIGPILAQLDLSTAQGTPVQKMHIAQNLRAVGEGPKALAYAYGVLQSARNDSDAALGFFSLIMMSPDDGLIPAVDVVGQDVWVRLEGDLGQANSFVVEEGVDRPADGVISPAHPTAAAAMGLKVGDSFVTQAGFGDDRQWRVAEIKHKYLHALHDVMENFENRFPQAKGFYTLTMPEGEIQPALDQIRRVSESHRKIADLYLVQNFPLNLVAMRLGGDTIGFSEYIRSLGFDIRTCVGLEPERLTARSAIIEHRASGAVLDAYAAWTVSTLDAFDVLKAVFGTLVLPQSAIDELRILRNKQELNGQSAMTVAWHNGQYIRQEHTSEAVAANRASIEEQIARIEAACDVRPATAPDAPSELASLITDTFGAHVLDAIHLAGEGHVLVSEDMHFRQIGETTSSVPSVWLQAIFAFAKETGRIGHGRYADAILKLAWRRHTHISIDAQTLRAVLDADDTDDLLNFQALTNFIGGKNAEIASHLNVAMSFLNDVWRRRHVVELRAMKATGILLSNLIRYREEDWALTLALLKRESGPGLRLYLDDWIKGHFLSADAMTSAEIQIDEMRRGLLERRSEQLGANGAGSTKRKAKTLKRQRRSR